MITGLSKQLQCVGIIECGPCPLVEFFAVKEAVGEPSVDGIDEDGSAVDVPGSPTTCTAVTLRVKRLTRFGVDKFPGGNIEVVPPVRSTLA